jgi:hypothetical protein
MKQVFCLLVIGQDSMFTLSQFGLADEPRFADYHSAFDRCMTLRSDHKELNIAIFEIVGTAFIQRWPTLLSASDTIMEQ